MEANARITGRVTEGLLIFLTERQEIAGWLFPLVFTPVITYDPLLIKGQNGTFKDAS